MWTVTQGAFFVETSHPASHEGSDVDTVDSVSFTVLLSASIHEGGMTLDKGPLHGFR